MARWSSRAWPLGAVALLLALFFAPVLLRGEVYALGDVARVYLPERAALSRALHGGGLPWWTPELGIGYPLLAEGQVGALYPLNWILHLLLTPAVGIAAATVLNYVLAGSGTYAYARGLGLSRAASWWSALVLALGGFYIAHLSHLSIMSVAAWLPWSLAFGRRVMACPPRARRAPWGAALGLAATVALQLVAGHPQMALLGLIVVLAQAVWQGWVDRRDAGVARRAALWCGALLVGLAVSAPQWLAGAQLTALSQRAGGVEGAFFTSYSFHPLLLATYVSPFVLGNPYPEGSVEFMPYVGLLPLALAGVMLWRRRAGRGFFLALGVAGVVLAFGRWNPLYDALRHVPVLNLFRVPARYLYWTSLALALLSGMGLDALLARQAPGARTGVTGAAAGGLLAVGFGVWVATLGRDADGLVRLWRLLPLVLGAGAVATLLMARRMARAPWLVLAFAVLLVDLYTYGAVLDGTYSATTPRAEAEAAPASLAFLAQDEGLYRIYTKEEITPALSVMRESYYPNIALTHGLSGANLYLPLVPRAYGAYLAGLDAERLNRLNVRYYLIPQLLPVDEASELYDVTDPLAALPTDRWIAIPPTRLREIVIESYLSHSADRPDGTLAAEIVLREASGREVTVPLRAGLETAEWAYERDDVSEVVRHALPPVASTWPSRSGFPPREHPGHTYEARATWDEPLVVTAVRIRPILPLAYVRVERVRLRDDAGGEQLLAHLAGLGDHTIAYRSEDVVVYRNEDALPRAYTLPLAEVRLAGDAATLPARLSADAVGAVTVEEYDDRVVTLTAAVDRAALLVLADMAYPGWRAEVDGVAASILTVDGVFRGVQLDAGAHRVTFTYRPAAR